MMENDHSTHGRGDAENGPDDPDCCCRTSPQQKDCADAGCGFCGVAERYRAKNPLTLQEFRSVNVARCEAAFFKLDHWTPTDYGCAIAGEVGEACNLLKKMLRGDKIPLSDVADELADVITYVDLLAARLGINLEYALITKFNKVSDRVNSPVRLKN